MKKICAIALAVVMMIFTVVPAFAAISPSASIEYDVVIENTEGGKGSYTTEILEDKKTAILTATPKDGYEFAYWVIDGKYTIISGNLKSAVLTVILGSDIVATPHFTKNGTEATVKVSQDPKPVSPQTGDFSFYYIGIFALAFVVMFGAVGIKLATSKK